MKKMESILDCEMEKVVMKTLATHSLNNLAEDGWCMDKFDDKIKKLLRKFGVVVGKTLSGYELALQKYLSLSKEQLDKLPDTETARPVKAYFELERWIGEKDKSFIVLHQNCYGITGNERQMSYMVIDGKKIPSRITFLAKYRDAPLSLQVRCEKERMSVVAVGEYSPEFICEFEKKVNEGFRRTFLGKTISHRLEFVDLKSYRREDLVYPDKLGKEIDDLVTTFQHWKKSKLIARWGYMLIGAPGTGKTTIGGLVHQLKGECTFLYCPASEIGSGDIQRIFGLAKLLAPTVMQIDDIDLIAKDRNENGNSYTAELMENLNGLGEEKKIFIILTTNDPSSIEKAIINRAGRVSSKIIFDGFGDCLSSLLEKYATTFELKLRPEDVKLAVKSQEKSIAEFTPDEARNVCERLYLLYGSQQITVDRLEKAIREVYRAFHDPSIMKQYL